MTAPARPTGASRRPRAGGGVTVREVGSSQVGAPEVVDPRRVPIPFVLVLAGVLAAMALALWGFTDTLVSARRIELPRLAVPSVAELTIEEARAELEQAGFTVTVLYQPNENRPKGEVLGQRPLAGYKADQGDLVTILASDGPLGWTVPSIVGQQLTDALVSFAGAPTRIEPVDAFDETIPVGEVMSTSPGAGSRVGPDGVVRVTVSAGPAPRTVPEVLNQPLELALVELGRAGLMVGDITRAHRPELAPNSVAELGTPPGTQVPRDTPIDIVIAVPQDLRKVPYLTGLQRGSAEEVLRSAGLSAQVVTVTVPAGDATVGRVTAQGTAPQAEVPAGTAIAITVAVASAPVAPEAPTPPAD